MRVFVPILICSIAVASCGEDSSSDTPDSGSDTSAGGVDASDGATADTAQEDATPGDDAGDDSDGDATVACEPPAPPNPDDYPEDPASLYSLGIETGRPAETFLPNNYSRDRWWPLIVFLHGYGANAFTNDLVFVGGGIRGRTTEFGYILVTPEGTVDASGKQFWNATKLCCGPNSGVDDSSYLRGLIEEAMDRYPIDPTRIIVMGHSNGGFMSYRMACDHDDLITAIGPIAGLSFMNPADCGATEPLSVLHTHGTADPDVAFLPTSYGPGADESAQRWVDRDGCLIEPVLRDVADFDTNLEGDDTAITEWGGCDRGTAVATWMIDDGPHVPAFQEDYTDRLLTWLLGHPRCPASE